LPPPAPRPQQKQSFESQAPSEAWQNTIGQVINQWQENLQLAPDKLAYLRNRGLSDETIQNFKLGYNPDWMDIRCEGDILKVAPGITIPWFADGELYAVRVRTFDEYLDKYMSVSGSKPSAGLFNADVVSAGETVTIVEGEFDCMLAVQHGLTAVTRGSAGDHRSLSSKWLKKLSSAKTVFGLLDNDKAGQDASEALFQQLKNFVPLPLPNGKDLTDYVKAGGVVADIFQHSEKAIASAQTRRAVENLSDYPMSQWAQPVPLPVFKADLQVNLRYISEIENHYFDLRTLLIKSPLNTGKTSLVKRMIAYLNEKLGKPARILVITHNQALTEDIANRLDLHNYRDIPVGQSEYAKSLDRVVSSYDSLYLFAGCSFDLVFIDETESFHPHIASGTMTGWEAQRNYETLQSIVGGAGQVVAADAHLSDISRQWFESVRGQVTAIENTYRHKWGNLTLHKDMNALIGKVLDKALQNVGAVIIPTNSRKISEQLRIFFTEAIGDGVTVINGWNSANSDSQVFIRSINEKLKTCRVLITSPTIADGIDVQTEVAGVYGIFTRNNWGSAASIMQQILRYRKAKSYQLYVSPTFEGIEETDWQNIYQRQMNRITGTAKSANFKAHSLDISNSTQEDILKLTAKYQAQRAIQRNNIFSYVVAFAQNEGFTIAYDESKNHVVQNQLKAARQQLIDEEKIQTLMLEALSPEAFDTKRQKGNISRNDYYALNRYKIERTAGQGITPELFGLLQTSRKRADFNRFCNLFEPLARLQERDRAQAEEKELLIRRRHYTRSMQLVTESLRAIFGDDWMNNREELTEEEINNRYRAYLDEHFAEIEMYLDTRKGLSKTPLNVLRRMLKRVNIKLASRQIMVDGNRRYVYWLDEEWLQRMTELACIALQARREHEEKPLLKTVSTTSSYTNLSNGINLRTDFEVDDGVSIELSTGETIRIPF
jgi:hypothetical protein